MIRTAVLLAAAVAIVVSVWQLERLRGGLAVEPLAVGETPATVYRPASGAPAPAVIITHGFAGSRQLMEAYALALARSGYVTVSFDFEGHGRNPTPMSGDVTKIEGTTRLLMAEIGRVTDAVLALPFVDGRVALLGHSMASDIIVRQAIADGRVGATIAISMFSQAVTATEPANLLVITGAWEGFLRAEALRAVRLVAPDAEEGETARAADTGVVRRSVVAPNVEHVGVLYATLGLRAARDWLDQSFERSSDGEVASTGVWIVLLLAGLIALAWPLTGLLPAGGVPPRSPPATVFLLAALAPAIVTPLALTLVETRLLPVLVADYLAAHLFVYGALALGILAWFGAGIGRIAWVSGLALAAYGIFVFGGAIDRYVASFMPHVGRLPIIAAIAVGAVLYMLADAILCEAGRARWWRVIVARMAFLVSLGIAVALDFERLFFLLIILPVIVIFYLIFGLMGGWVGRRTRAPFAPGLGMGLTLAWALGVTFPMFVGT